MESIKNYGWDPKVQEISEYIIACINESHKFETLYNDLNTNVDFTSDCYFSSGEYVIKKEVFKDKIKWNKLKLKDALEKLESLKDLESMVLYNQIKQEVLTYFIECKRCKNDSWEWLYVHK